MPTILDICSVTKRFHAGVAGCSASVTAVHALSLRIHDGERVAVCGPAGAGKTTLLLCAAGLLRPDSGSVTAPSATRRAPPAAAYIGGPATTLGGLTVADVLEWERRALAVRHPACDDDAFPSVAEALARAEAAHLATVRTRLLSVAAARRVAIARALLARPQLLVLDEPHADAAPGEWPALAVTLRGLSDGGVALLASARTAAALAALDAHVVHVAAVAGTIAGAVVGGRRRPRPRGGDGQGAAAWRFVAERPPGA